MNLWIGSILNYVMAVRLTELLGFRITVLHIVAGVILGFLLSSFSKCHQRIRSTIYWVLGIGFFLMITIVMGFGLTEEFGKSLGREIVCFYEWGSNYLRQKQMPLTIYEQTTAVMLVSMLSLGVYKVGIKYRNILIGIFVGAWGSVLWSIIADGDNQTWCTLLMIIVTMLLCFEQYKKQIGITIEGQIQKKTYYRIVGIMIGSVLSIACVGTMRNPLHLKWIDNFIFSKPLQTNQRLMNYPYSGALGGPIELGDQLLFEVEAPDAFYLKAQSKEVYKENYWTNEQERVRVEGGAVTFADTCIFEEGIDDLGLAVDEDYIVITLKAIQSELLLTPPKTKEIKFFKPVNTLYQTEDIYSLGKIRSNGFSYRVEMYQPYFDKSTWEDVLRDTLHVVDEQLLQIYTQLPTTITERTKKLAENLTQGVDTNYDKIQQIKHYLTSQYEYTMTPKEIPRGIEFVDYFLFEEKEGYCTYFATALSVLGRCVGVPTRYVEGYLMPKEYMPHRLNYPITEKEAHAWVEVYFEQIGWVPIEATPGYELLDASDREAIEVMLKRLEGIEGEVVKHPPSEGAIQNRTIYKYLVIGGLVGLSIGGSIFYCYRAQNKRLSPRVKIQRAYISYLQWMKKQFKGIKDYETDEQYFYRMKEEGLSEIKLEVLEHIVQEYYKATYSQSEVTAEDYAQFKEYIKRIKCKRVK